jgi:GxxExxY protein
MLEPTGPERDPLTSSIIGAAIEVHRNLGPGLLESIYETCLAWELRARGVAIERQVPVPVVYKGHQSTSRTASISWLSVR